MIDYRVGRDLRTVCSCCKRMNDIIWVAQENKGTTFDRTLFLCEKCMEKIVNKI